MRILYTGIGARATPGPLVDAHELTPLSRLKRWGYSLGKLDMILRSGAADGADHAFENGCDIANGKKEIYLPWAGFNESDSPLYYIPIEAFEAAADVYGASWKYISQPTKKLMARNMLQIMGFGLDTPSKFVLCWTPDGCNTKQTRTKNTGGTGQAIAYAYEMEIPIFNFKNENGEDEFIDFLSNHLNGMEWEDKIE